jgi:polyisoprenoid-binding protein YceI
MMMTTITAHDRFAGTRWQLVPGSSQAEFSARHFWGLVTVKGHFARVDGWLAVNDHDGCEFELTLDAASLNTGNPRRDAHLRSAEFFDVADHPVVRFASTHVSDAAYGRLHVEGELEAAGARIPLQFQPSYIHNGDQLELTAITTVDQRRLGMTWSPLGMTRAPVTVTVRARLRRTP